MLLVRFLCSLFLFGFAVNIYLLPAQGPQPESELNDQVQRALKAYPVPPVKSNSLFYLQRNKNSNTVMYEANLTPDGKLDPKKPVSVYWIRYTEGGVIKELNWIQRWLAYGVDFEPAKDGSGNFVITPVALKHRRITVTVDKDGKANAFMMMNGKYARLNRIYAQALETSWLPTVKFVQMKGEEIKTKQEVYEYIFPKN